MRAFASPAARVALLCVLGLGGSAFGDNVLVNGDFEQMPNWNNGIGGDGWYTLLVGNSIPGWTIEPGYGATIHINGIYPTISGSYSLNTDAEGLNGHNVNMYQDFASNNGDAYQLTFDWTNWFESTAPLMRVSVTDTVSNLVLAAGVYGLDPGLHSEVFNFAGTGNPLRLRVEHSPESGFNDNTFIADNFSVVPAPGAGALLGLGAIGAGRRRR